MEKILAELRVEYPLATITGHSQQYFDFGILRFDELLPFQEALVLVATLSLLGFIVTGVDTAGIAYDVSKVRFSRPRRQ